MQTDQIVIDGLELGQFDEVEAEARLEEIEFIITKKRTGKGLAKPWDGN